MPKIVVIVEKDETGRLWNYVLPEEDLAGNLNAFSGRSLLIHQSDFRQDESVPVEDVRDKSSLVELGAMPIFEEKYAHAESKRKKKRK